jgi:hypothetical protein
VRIGFAALIPNVLPVLVYFGVLGFSGVTLNTVTPKRTCGFDRLPIRRRIEFRR